MYWTNNYNYYPLANPLLSFDWSTQAFVFCKDIFPSFANRTSMIRINEYEEYYLYISIYCWIYIPYCMFSLPVLYRDWTSTSWQKKIGVELKILPAQLAYYPLRLIFAVNHPIHSFNHNPPIPNIQYSIFHILCSIRVLYVILLSIISLYLFMIIYISITCI